LTAATFVTVSDHPPVNQMTGTLMLGW